MRGRRPLYRLSADGELCATESEKSDLRRDAETHGSGERPRPWLTQGIGASDFGAHGILQARKSAWVLASLSAQIAHGSSHSKAKARNRHIGRNSDDDGPSQPSNASRPSRRTPWEQPRDASYLPRAGHPPSGPKVPLILPPAWSWILPPASVWKQDGPHGAVA